MEIDKELPGLSGQFHVIRLSLVPSQPRNDFP
jgi:hypothetical protein